MGGTRAQMALAEREVAAGRHADWPMVLAALPHLADPARIDSAGRRPFWTYAHVPMGSPLDMTDAVTALFEKFAPGFRDVVVAVRSVPAARLADHNANLVGGDIGVGGNNMVSALTGPAVHGSTPGPRPIPHAYLCSSATPPGGGVHGMSGYYAARTVLRREFGLEMLPPLGPSTRPAYPPEQKSPVATASGDDREFCFGVVTNYAVSVIGRSTQLIRSRSFLPVTSIGCSAFCLRSPSSSLLPPSTLATSRLTNVPS